MANQLDQDFDEKYAYEASEFYKLKMLELVNNDRNRKHELEGYVPDGKGGIFKKLENTWMYRIATLQSADGHCLYEFLIEYNTDEPSVGIYYGCRGITVRGYDHVKGIERFRKERAIVLPEMCKILNNTFPNKDFSHRFKVTDNANDNTYWLFWLTLNEEEDINKVGITATTIIRNVFRRYLNGEELSKGELPQKHFENEPTCFTKATYEALITSIRYIDDRKDEDSIKTAMARNLFERFINRAECNNLIVMDSNYERAWRVQRENHVDFARMAYAFFKYLHNKGLINKAFSTDSDKATIQVPWTALVKVFLDQDGNAYSQSIKTQVSKIKQDEDFQKKINYYISIIKDMLKE